MATGGETNTGLKDMPPVRGNPDIQITGQRRGSIARPDPVSYESNFGSDSDLSGISGTENREETVEPSKQDMEAEEISDPDHQKKDLTENNIENVNSNITASTTSTINNNNNNTNLGQNINKAALRTSQLYGSDFGMDAETELLLASRLKPSVATFTTLPGMENSLFSNPNNNDTIPESIPPSSSLSKDILPHEQEPGTLLPIPLQSRSQSQPQTQLQHQLSIKEKVSSEQEKKDNNNSNNNNNNNNNPFSPPTHLTTKKNKMNVSGHARSRTNLPSNFGVHTTEKHYRTKSQMTSTEIKDASPPKGPDLTFLCTSIEKKTILYNELSNPQMTQLMHIHNEAIEKIIDKWNGYIIEKSNPNKIYEYLVVFAEPYQAVECGADIQEALYGASWPQFYLDLEQTGKIQYAGKPSESFCGLRVGVCMHTGRVDSDINPYDSQKETLNVEEKLLFEVEYKGTCVELCKEMCHYVFGGELLGTGAIKAALAQSPHKNLNIASIETIGNHYFDHLRNTKLLCFIPNGWERHFPLKILNGGKTEIERRIYDEEDMGNYDPFPTNMGHDKEMINAVIADNEEDRGRTESGTFILPGPKASHRRKQMELERKRTSQQLFRDSSVDKLKHRARSNSKENDKYKDSNQFKIEGPPPTDKSKREQMKRASRSASPSGRDSPRSAGSSNYSSQKSFLHVANPKHMVRYFQGRPPDLPKEYGEDSEFQCSVCHEVRKWVDGVWRCPLWPSFDVCAFCAENALAKSDPTDHRKAVIHHQWNSNLPMLTHAQDVEVLQDMNGDENNEHNEMLKTIRKELSSIIENLTEIKLRRLQNMKEYWDKKVHDESKLVEIEKEFQETEEELAQWRRDRSLHEEQEQKIERRQSLVISGMATPMDLIADEELVQNFEEYDPREDFTIVKSRFVDLNRLYWIEDHIVCQRFERYDQSINSALRERARTMETFETQMVQMKNLFSNRPSQEMANLSGGDMSSQDSEAEIIHQDDDIIEAAKPDNPTSSKENNSKPIENKEAEKINPPTTIENNANEPDDELEEDLHDDDEEEEENGDNFDEADIALGQGPQNIVVKKMKTKMKLELRRFTEVHQKEVDTFISQLQRKDRQIQGQKEQISDMQRQIDQLKQYVSASQSELAAPKYSVRMTSTDIVDELRGITSKNLQSALHEPEEEEDDEHIAKKEDDLDNQDFAAINGGRDLEAYEETLESQEAMPWSSVKETDFQPVSENVMPPTRKDTEVDSMRSEEEYDGNQDQNDVAEEEREMNATRPPVDVKNIMIDKLQRIVQEQEQKIEDLTRSKLELINSTCLQMERLRDQIQQMPGKKMSNAIRMGEEKREEGELPVTSSPFSWLSFGRTKFSAPVAKYDVQDIAKSKITLANETTEEINRLRDIVKMLGRQLERSKEKRIG